MRRVNAFLLAAFLVLGMIFSGCTKNPSTPQSQLELQGGDTVSSSLEQLTKWGTSSCAVQSGYYYIEQNTIYYIDYASQKRIALCSRPECEHKDETCDAKLERYAVIFSTGEQLYLYYPEMLGGSDAQDAVSRIDVMEMDGSNRKTFYTFDLYDTIIEDLYTDGKDLYFILNSCDLKNGEYVNFRYELVRLNLKTAEREKIKDCAENEFLMGGTSDYFFLKKLIYPPEEMQNINLRHQAFVYDRLDQEEVLIEEWDNAEAVWYFNEGKLYLADYDTFDVARIDLASGQRADLVQGEEILSQIGTAEGEKYFPSLKYISEKYLYFELTQSSGEKRMLGIDLENHRTKEFTLSYQIRTDHDEYEQFWTILASNNGQYLVCCGAQEVPIVDTLSNGAQISRTVPEYQYGLITQQDFFEGNAEGLVPIENIDLVWR